MGGTRLLVNRFLGDNSDFLEKIERKAFYQADFNSRKKDFSVQHNRPQCGKMENLVSPKKYLVKLTL